MAKRPNLKATAVKVSKLTAEMLAEFDARPDPNRDQAYSPVIVKGRLVK
jgi:hypothetical protein